MKQERIIHDLTRINALDRSYDDHIGEIARAILAGDVAYM